MEYNKTSFPYDIKSRQTIGTTIQNIGSGYS